MSTTSSIQDFIKYATPRLEFLSKPMIKVAVPLQQMFGMTKALKSLKGQVNLEKLLTKNPFVMADGKQLLAKGMTRRYNQVFDHIIANVTNQAKNATPQAKAQFDKTIKSLTALRNSSTETQIKALYSGIDNAMKNGFKIHPRSYSTAKQTQNTIQKNLLNVLQMKHADRAARKGALPAPTKPAGTPDPVATPANGGAGAQAPYGGNTKPAGTPDPAAKAEGGLADDIFNTMAEHPVMTSLGVGGAGLGLGGLGYSIGNASGESAGAAKGMAGASALYQQMMRQMANNYSRNNDSFWSRLSNVFSPSSAQEMLLKSSSVQYPLLAAYCKKKAQQA